MKKILKSKKGESIVELLAAILIMGLASGLMAMMISTSINLNTQAKNSDQMFYQEMNDAEIKTIINEANMLDQKITISDGTESVVFDIDIYGSGKEKSVIAFGKK